MYHFAFTWMSLWCWLHYLIESVFVYNPVILFNLTLHFCIIGLLMVVVSCKLGVATYIHPDHSSDNSMLLTMKNFFSGFAQSIKENYELDMPLLIICCIYVSSPCFMKISIDDVKLITWYKLEQLECLHSEIPSATPWLPILLIRMRSQVKTRQSQSYNFKKIGKKINFYILQLTLHTTHLLKLLIKIYIWKNMKWIQPEL